MTNENNTETEINGTFARLRDGSWGVRIVGEAPRFGDTVRVTKRDGSGTTVRVARLVWSGTTPDGQPVHLLATAYAPRTAPAPATQVDGTPAATPTGNTLRGNKRRASTAASRPVAAPLVIDAEPVEPTPAHTPFARSFAF